MEIRLLSNVNHTEMAEIGRLRTEVWVGEADVNPQSLGPEPWIDPVDQGACQWTVRDGRRLVAAARMTLHDDPASIPYHKAFQGRLPGSGPYGAMNRLVVHPDCRGQGLAQLLDCLRLRHAPRLGAVQVVVVASGRRVLALEALGFENLGVPNETPDLLRTQQPYSILVHRLRDLPKLPDQGSGFRVQGSGKKDNN
jgi:GNAT superfamily N-acetyltransferase